MTKVYQNAKTKYKTYFGIDTDKVIEKLASIPISVHCWQGDDVQGFDSTAPLTGGIQATGNYPGKARTPSELMSDIELALALAGGKHKINLHASYAIFDENESADRDSLEPKHFAKWVKFAKDRNLGIDFNPTLFSHPKAASLTLSSPDDEIRNFWIRHVKACIRISEYFARETGYPCVMNIWIPDGLKDIPADRLGPRQRFLQSLDEILTEPYDKSKVFITLESKVFGIGLESYTAGSSEFALGYTLSRGIVPLMDNGHYHPTELVSDKISSLLAFSDKLALHVTRPVRWDSDHVVRLDDETIEIAKELIASGRVDDTFIALDYFDASINRIAAWVVGMRNIRKALLIAMLTPHEKLKALQDAGEFTRLLVIQEELKSMPWNEIWDEYCKFTGVPTGFEWFDKVSGYEKLVLSERR